MSHYEAKEQGISNPRLRSRSPSSGRIMCALTLILGAQGEGPPPDFGQNHSIEFPSGANAPCARGDQYPDCFARSQPLRTPATHLPFAKGGSSGCWNVKTTPALSGPCGSSDELSGAKPQTQTQNEAASCYMMESNQEQSASMTAEVIREWDVP